MSKKGATTLNTLLNYFFPNGMFLQFDLSKLSYLRVQLSSDVLDVRLETRHHGNAHNRQHCRHSNTQQDYHTIYDVTPPVSLPEVAFSVTLPTII